MEPHFAKNLELAYGIYGPRITEQEGGWSARAFRVETNNGVFFLKAYEKNKPTFEKWTATIDHHMSIVIWLHENTRLNGRIICPILTREGEHKSEDSYCVYLLFPYIEGNTIAGDPMTKEQGLEVAETIAELHKHGAEIPLPTQAIREDFSVPFCDELRSTLSKLDRFDADETVAILRAFSGVLERSIERTKQLARAMHESSRRFVLCHTDVHGWNLMQSRGNVVLVDWEGMKLALAYTDIQRHGHLLRIGR